MVHTQTKPKQNVNFTSLTLAIFHDASFGNLSDHGRSQGSFIIFLVDGKSNSNPLS